MSEKTKLVIPISVDFNNLLKQTAAKHDLNVAQLVRRLLALQVEATLGINANPLTYTEGEDNQPVMSFIQAKKN